MPRLERTTLAGVLEKGMVVWWQRKHGILAVSYSSSLLWVCTFQGQCQLTDQRAPPLCLRTARVLYAPPLPGW